MSNTEVERSLSHLHVGRSRKPRPAANEGLIGLCNTNDTSAIHIGLSFCGGPFLVMEIPP